jgi:hypothetical protein
MGRKGEFEGGKNHELNLTDESVARFEPPRVTHSEFLPPSEEAHYQMRAMIESHQEHLRSSKAQAAREQDQQDKAKASPYGLGGNKALRRHLAEKHELHEEDAMEMERPAHFHRQWHTKGEYNPDRHTHG